VSSSTTFPQDGTGLHVRLVQVSVKLACGGRFGAKVAVTERAWLSVSWQEPLPEQSPDQPAETEPGFGIGLSVTVLPLLKPDWQLVPQLTPHEAAAAETARPSEPVGPPSRATWRTDDNNPTRLPLRFRGGHAERCSE
jgi:hypothetical protein